MQTTASAARHRGSFNTYKVSATVVIGVLLATLCWQYKTDEQLDIITLFWHYRTDEQLDIITQ